MSKPKAFDYEAIASNDEIIEHLEKIVSGLKAGRISLSQYNSSLALEVKHQAKFSIQVKESPKAKSLKLKMKWREAAPAASEEVPTTNPVVD